MPAHNVYSIWLIDKTLSGDITPGQSGSGNNDSEGVRHIPQISKVGTSPSDGVTSYQDTRCGGSYLSAEMQSVYSSASADWDIILAYIFEYANNRSF